MEDEYRNPLRERYGQKEEDSPTPGTISFTPPTPPDLELVDQETLLKIGTYILEGLNEKEAAVLAGCPYSLVESLEDDKDYRLYIEKVKIKFKHQHMKTISSQGDAKTSQWMIERNIPKDTGHEVVNPIALIIRDIQRQEDLPVVAQIIDAKSKKKSSQRNKGPEDTSILRLKKKANATGEGIIS